MAKVIEATFKTGLKVPGIGYEQRKTVKDRLIPIKRIVDGKAKTVRVLQFKAHLTQQAEILPGRKDEVLSFLAGKRDLVKVGGVAYRWKEAA